MSSRSAEPRIAASRFAALLGPARARWRRWIDRRIPPGREVVLDQRRIFIFPTLMGFGYLLTAFLLFIAGINYDNSLILNFSFFLGSLFVVAILQTFSNLSGLVITAGTTEPAFAGTEAKFNLHLGKSRRKQHCSILLQWHGFSAEPHNLIELEKVPVQMLLKTARRGVFHPERLKIISIYPLGLIQAWTWIALDMECLVYPKPVSCDLPPQTQQSGHDGKAPVPEGNEDFDGLRAYQETDSLNTVDWKAYARTGTLYTKRFHGYQAESRWLQWDQVPAQNVELKLSQLCYLVLDMERSGAPFGLQLPGVKVEPGSGPEHQKRCLEALARF